MTEDQFNYFLERTGNSFDRKIALMCFSGRPSERIANRVSFPVMLAYANMQDIVVDNLTKAPRANLGRTFSDAARTVRTDFYKATGKKVYKVMLEENSEVEYSTVDGQSYASINCVYYLKDEKGTSKVEETYILREDENDRWKILGWKKYEGNEWEQ
jgi:hypothetical protein